MRPSMPIPTSRPTAPELASGLGSLFAPLKIRGVQLANRFVMAPMTRSRADDVSGVPSPLAEQYYAQRANAGLIVTEGTFPSPMGKGYVRTPGIHSAAQIEVWKRITAAVHAKGGVISLISGVIDLAVQQLQHQCHLGLFGCRRDPAQAFGGDLQAGGVVQPLAVAAETDNVRYS